MKNIEYKILLIFLLIILFFNNICFAVSYFPGINCVNGSTVYISYNSTIDLSNCKYFYLCSTSEDILNSFWFVVVMDCPFNIRKATSDELLNDNNTYYYSEASSENFVGYVFIIPDNNHSYDSSSNSYYIDWYSAYNISNIKVNALGGNIQDVVIPICNTFGATLDSSVPTNNISYPYIISSDNLLCTGNFDYLDIRSRDFVEDNFQTFYLLTFDYYDKSDDLSSIYPKKVIEIDGSTNKYFSGTFSDGYSFLIPSNDLGLNFKSGNKYGFKLAIKQFVEFEGEINWAYKYIDERVFVISELTNEDELQNSIDNMNSKLDEQNEKLEEQTQAIKDSNETNKNIFEKIGDILSYINPFSDNFFGKKLVELILDGLKSLFIPDDDFINNFFTELKNWFSDRLGFLFYPFELIIDILNKILNIDFSEPIFNIPDINEPFTNTKLLSATTYNLNSLLDNEIFNNIHNIYLLCVDAFIIFCLVNLAKNKFEEVTKR